jgi:hypothetical protein
LPAKRLSREVTVTMAFNTITIEHQEHIATLTLNRPEQMNTFTNEMARKPAKKSPLAVQIGRQAFYGFKPRPAAATTPTRRRFTRHE